MSVKITVDFPDDLIQAVKDTLVMDKPEYVKGFILEAVKTKVQLRASAKKRAEKKGRS